jgi:multidrug efflux pump subunit AcrA (membrane-fusion protein)
MVWIFSSLALFALLPALLPASLYAQATPGPSGSNSPLEPPTLTASPTATATAVTALTSTPTSTPSPEPTATATATIAPYQVSPLVPQASGSLPDDSSPLWIGGAALLVLAGSGLLVLAERRGKVG